MPHVWLVRGLLRRNRERVPRAGGAAVKEWRGNYYVGRMFAGLRRDDAVAVSLADLVDGEVQWQQFIDRLRRGDADCHQGKRVDFQADWRNLLHALPWRPYQRVAGTAPYDGKCGADKAAKIDWAEGIGTGGQRLANDCTGTALSNWVSWNWQDFAGFWNGGVSSEGVSCES